MARWRSPDDARELAQVVVHRHRLVVADVVDPAGGRPLQRVDHGARGVAELDLRHHRAVRADDGEPAAAHELDHGLRAGRERPVEATEAQRDPLDPLLVAGRADLALGGRDRVDDGLDAAVALLADRVVLGPRALVGAEPVDAEERLAHEPLRPGRHRGGEQVAHAVLAQLVGGPQVRRPVGLGGDPGQHVDDGVGPRGTDGAHECVGVQGVGDDRLGTEVGEQRRLGLARGHRDHLVAAVDQLSDDGRADGPARSGQEDSRCVHDPSDETALGAVTTRGVTVTGPASSRER